MNLNIIIKNTFAFVIHIILDVNYTKEKMDKNYVTRGFHMAIECYLKPKHGKLETREKRIIMFLPLKVDRKR